jgi:hypothetical protein
MHICRGCGAFAVFNEYHNVYQCRTCGELADLATVDGSKSAILLHEELAAANIHVRLGLRPREFEVRSDEGPAGDEVTTAESADDEGLGDAGGDAADADESADAE